MLVVSGAGVRNPVWAVTSQRHPACLQLFLNAARLRGKLETKPLAAKEDLRFFRWKGARLNAGRVERDLAEARVKPALNIIRK